jgi:F0F1-type ATP synthase membrane subunit c/vacuolar-type H+-ATPase subunit K
VIVGAEGNAPEPAAQWPARLSGSLLLGQGVVLLVAAGCAWWEMRSAGQWVAAATAAHPVSAADAREATAVMAAIAEDMVIYSLVMAPLFLLGGLWLLLARSEPSRAVAFVVVAIGSMCCIANACCIDYTTQSEVADAVMAAAPPESAWQELVGTLAEGWLLTPIVSLVVAVLVGVQLSWDNDAAARMTLFLDRQSWPVRP